jgi:hypothetical protein
MRHVTGVAVRIALALLPASAALAADQPVSGFAMVVPAFSQLVRFSVPAQFKIADEHSNDSFYIRELVPHGESADQWTQMLELTGTRDLAASAGATPQALLSRMAAGFREHCPETFAMQELGPRRIDGYDGFVTIASCGRVRGKSGYGETAVMLAVKGTKDLYTLQWAERGSGSPHTPAIDRAYWEKRLEALGPVKLCAPQPGEGPPYASCLGK